MKVTGLDVRTYRIALDPPFHPAWDPTPRESFEESLVIVETDAGVRGMAGGASVPDIRLLGELLVGTELDDAERVHLICRSVDFHHGRNWTVEVAVADAAARAVGQPLWRHLGGERNRFPAYVSTGQRLSVPERLERVARCVDGGVGALKLRFEHEDWRRDLEVVEAVRGLVGDSVEIMVDANQGWRMPGDVTPAWDVATAGSCASALGELGVYWLEEPLDTSDVEGYVGLREMSPVRIAGGEMVRSLSETRRLIESGAFDVVQNDVVLAGGLVGARQVAGWAEASSVVWSPHTWSTGLGLLANLHAALAFSTAEFIEVPYDPPEWSPERRDFVLGDPLPIEEDGTIRVPPGPGLGLELDLGALETHRIG